MRPLLTILISFICLFAQRQIKTDLWGLKLGSSTKAQVNTVMRGKKLQCENIQDGVVVKGPIVYGGERWNWVTFHFLNGKLFGVNLSMDSQHSNYDTFVALGQTLSDKYSNYEDDFDANTVEAYIQFVDEKNIGLKLCYRQDNNKVYLIYSDMNMLEEKRQQHRDRGL